MDQLPPLAPINHNIFIHSTHVNQKEKEVDENYNRNPPAVRSLALGVYQPLYNNEHDPKLFEHPRSAQLYLALIKEFGVRNISQMPT